MKTADSENGYTASGHARVLPLGEGEKAEIRLQLDRVLRSPAFRGSKRSQDFLQYTVDHVLNGQADQLKGRNIGVDVFGRGPAYDPNVDAIVRVNANELRKRLAQYYVETAHSEELRIELPLGSYIPEFQRIHPEELPAEASRLDRWGMSRRWKMTLGAMLVLLVAVSFAMLSIHSETPSLDQFWAPVLKSPGTTLICSGHPVVYFLSRRVHDAYRQRAAIDPAAGPYVVKLGPNETIEGRDIVPVQGQYVGIGDAVAANMLNALFVRKNKPAQVRFGHDISFSDLRNAPAILIGAYSNRWTLQMTNELRYVFVVKEGVKGVEDRLTRNKVWMMPNIAPDGRTPEDYAIVSRMFDSQSGEMIISAAGITQYGTRAAGEFLTTESLVEAAVRQAPRDWAARNMQVVLHTRVVGETPSPPEIVTVHFW